MPTNYKGLCYIKPCLYDIGTRWSDCPTICLTVNDPSELPDPPTGCEFALGLLNSGTRYRQALYIWGGVTWDEVVFVRVSFSSGYVLSFDYETTGDWVAIVDGVEYTGTGTEVVDPPASSINVTFLNSSTQCSYVMDPIVAPLEGYYSAFLTSTDTIDIFANWRLTYDGNEIFGGGFAPFFQSIGGNFFEGLTGSVGTQGFLYIKTDNLVSDIVIEDNGGNPVLTITNADLDFNAPSNCAIFTIDPFDTTSSQIQGYGSNASSNDYGYINTNFSNDYPSVDFQGECEQWAQDLIGTSSDTSVTVNIGATIEIVFNNIYTIPPYFFDFNNTPFNFSTTSCP